MFGYIYHYIMGKMEPTDKRLTLLGNWKIVHFKLAKKVSSTTPADGRL